MPVVHSLLQVHEEIDAIVEPLSDEQLWARPGGAASVGFHLTHLAGSLDRLFTYARGETLSDAQKVALGAEAGAGSMNDQPATLLASAHDAIGKALDQLRATPVHTLHEQRRVGRAGLPSTCWVCCSTPPSTPSGTPGRSSRRRKSFEGCGTTSVVSAFSRIYTSIKSSVRRRTSIGSLPGVGRYSCAMYPVNPRSAMVLATKR